MTVRVCQTVLQAMDVARPEQDAIGRAAQIIRQGGPVAFPTETVYGLSADALNRLAVERIFWAKGRPADNPLIVHIAEPGELDTLASEVPKRAWELISRFWPGPLTLVLRRSQLIPDVTTGGLETVAVRVPANPVALALIRASGCPIAAPSANGSGRPSPTRAAHVMEDLQGRVALALDGGPCLVGVESTVLDVTEDPPVLLRPGGVPREALETVVGRIRVLGMDNQSARRSPGTRYRHYAPHAQFLLALPGEAESMAMPLVREGRRVGVMTQRPFLTNRLNLLIRVMPPQPEGYSRELFAALRELDALQCEVIVAEAVEEQGLGVAVMDRLRRAASATDISRTSTRHRTTNAEEVSQNG